MSQLYYEDTKVDDEIDEPQEPFSARLLDLRAAADRLDIDQTRTAGIVGDRAKEAQETGVHPADGDGQGQPLALGQVPQAVDSR